MLQGVALGHVLEAMLQSNYEAQTGLRECSPPSSATEKGRKIVGLSGLGGRRHDPEGAWTVPTRWLLIGPCGRTHPSEPRQLLMARCDVR